MSEYKEDAFGDVYKKDSFGTYKDFWGTRYSLIYTKGGGGTCFVILLLAIYQTFFKDNPAAYICLGTLILSIVFFLIGLFIKNRKGKAFLYTIAIYFTFLTLTSSGDIYEIYTEANIGYAILSISFFVYMLVCLSGNSKVSILFCIIELLLGVLYLVLVEPNIFTPHLQKGLSTPSYLAVLGPHLETLMLTFQDYLDYFYFVIMVIELPLFYAIIKKRLEKRPVNLSLFALMLALVSGICSFLYISDYIIRILRSHSSTFSFRPLCSWLLS